MPKKAYALFDVIRYLMPVTVCIQFFKATELSFMVLNTVIH